MKHALRISAQVLLLFNAFTAIYGGAMLIADPTGSLIQMPLSMLDNSVFRSFLVPGIFLFACIGFFSLILYLVMFTRKHIYPMAIIAQGVIIEIWLLVQVSSIPYRHFLQLLYCAIGLVLIAIGAIYMRLYPDNRPHKLALN